VIIAQILIKVASRNLGRLDDLNSSGDLCIAPVQRFPAGVGLPLAQHGGRSFDVPLSLQNRIIRV
jgi:hypothetical protein